MLGFLGSHHTIAAEDDEGDGENLAHVEWEGGLEGFLDFLGVLDEEAEGEDIRQTEAEIPACLTRGWFFLLDHKRDSLTKELLIDENRDHGSRDQNGIKMIRRTVIRDNSLYCHFYRFITNLYNSNLPIANIGSDRSLIGSGFN